MLMSVVAEQLELEMVRRLHVVGLLDRPTANRAVEQVPWSAALWGSMLEGSDRALAERVAPDLAVALWPPGVARPPQRWWRTPLGRALKLAVP